MCRESSKVRNKTGNERKKRNQVTDKRAHPFPDPGPGTETPMPNQKPTTHAPHRDPPIHSAHVTPTTPAPPTNSPVAGRYQTQNTKPTQAPLSNPHFQAGPTNPLPHMSCAKNHPPKSKTQTNRRAPEKHHTHAKPHTRTHPFRHPQSNDTTTASPPSEPPMAKTRKPPPPPPAGTLAGAASAASSPPPRRKKKGRPSLLDLQRRSLRLQAQNPNPTPSPSPSPSGRSTRGNRNPSPSDDDEEGGGGGRRREKRLKSVLSAAGEEEEEEANDSANATAAREGDDALDCGPAGATALPDKKLLVFILDRLQKKDTYGVFSEPVDPEELPDYHELIEHPMDFATVREKLANGAYRNLEQFEKDIFLITSNAMCYNAPETIYYRQARSIEELAKKNFENLRQASDDDEEQEPKTVVRRGRPPNKTKKTVGKTADNASSDFSNTKVAKSEDNTETVRKKGWTGDKAGNTNISTRDLYGLHQSTFGSLSDKKSERNGYYSGTLKYGKKATSLDENRRSTYEQPLVSAFSHEHPLTAALDAGRKLLVPVGLQQEYAYVRSLARFAAKLGPIGWDIAAKSIRRVLPPGTNFGPGWVVDGEPAQNTQPPLMPTCIHPFSQPTVLSSNTVSKIDELSQRSEPSSNGDATGEGYMARTHPVPSTSADFGKSLDFCKVPKYENGVSISCDGIMNTIGPRSPCQQLNQNPEILSNMNGVSAATNIISQSVGKRLFGSDMQMTHAQALGMFSGINGRINGYLHGHHPFAERTKTAQNANVGNTGSPLPDAGHDSPGRLQQHSVPPNLKVRVQSSGSPPTGKVLDLKQPDLALQL